MKTFKMKTLLSLSVFLVVLWSGAAGARVLSHAARPAAPERVACTVLGCQPIPAACIPKEEHSFGGTPTGYDTIVCPPGVWPFR
jgi:hypothetical protein